MKNIFLFLTALFCFVNVHGQFTIQHFSKKEGLLDNKITKITQSDEGFIWMLNAGNICRFNGNNFKYYPYKYDLTSWMQDYGSTVFKYQNNSLIFSSQGELRKFDGNAFADYPLPSDTLFNYYHPETGDLMGTKDAQEIDKYNQYIWNGIIYSDKGSRTINCFEGIPGYALNFKLTNHQYSYYSSENNYIYLVEKDSIIQIETPVELDSIFSFANDRYFYNDLIIFVNYKNSDLTIFNREDWSYSNVKIGTPIQQNQDFQYLFNEEENGYSLVRVTNDEIAVFDGTNQTKLPLTHGGKTIRLSPSKFIIYSRKDGTSLIDFSKKSVTEIDILPLHLKINETLVDKENNVWLATNSGLYKLSECEITTKNWKDYFHETTGNYNVAASSLIYDEFSNGIVDLFNNQTGYNYGILLIHHNSVKPLFYKEGIEFIKIKDISNNSKEISEEAQFYFDKRWGYINNDTIFLTDNKGSFKSFLPSSILLENMKVENLKNSSYSSEVSNNVDFFIDKDTYYLLSNYEWYVANFETLAFDKILSNSLPIKLQNRNGDKLEIGENRGCIYSLNSEIKDTLKFEKIYWGVQYIDALNRSWFIDNYNTIILDNQMNLLFVDSSLFLKDKNISSYIGITDRKNNFWIPSDIGINFINPNVITDSIKPVLIDRKNGLPGYFIHQLFDDGQGRLWMVLPTGIHWLDLNKFYATKEIVITELSKNGFPDFAYIGCHLDNDSNMVFFTKEHENQVSLHSNSFFTYQYAPNLFFEKIQINDSIVSFPIQIGNVLDISQTLNSFDYDENNISIYFQGIDYRFAKNLMFEYKLDGFKTKWISTQSNYVNFENLNPGNYTFQVRCCLDDQCSETISYSFVIKPPYWQTWWFRLTLGVIGLLIIIFIFKGRTKHLKNKQVKLEKKVELATEEIREQRDEIIDSINYAKRIQSAILPPSKIVKEYLKQSFILYKPKDIVAGDFYWMEHISITANRTKQSADNDEIASGSSNHRNDDSKRDRSPSHCNNVILFAAADCTGHGVPGAMVSVVCNNALNRSVREYGLTDPGKILDKTREIVIQEFEKSDEEVKDGMDIALCSLEGNKLLYSGAHNPLWIIRNGEIIETKANKQPIGKFDNLLPYTTHSFNLVKGDTFYIFSDGYSDQFGGEKGKKYKSGNFKKLLLSIQEHTMEKQHQLLDEEFEKWRGKIEQIDDVCIIGVRI